MPPYADIYVLARSRDEATVTTFLDHFAPDREETQDEYTIPQNAGEPRMTLGSAAEVVSHCCLHPAETQSIYWRRVGDGDPAYGMVFFTSDGCLILGLSVAESNAQALLSELRKHTRSDYSYATVESPPPDSGAEFRKLCS
jgi:hypothetical protein